MRGMDPLAQGHLPRWLGLQVALGARVSHWLQRLVIFVALMKEGSSTSESHQDGGVGSESPFFEVCRL